MFIGLSVHSCETLDSQLWNARFTDMKRSTHNCGTIG